MTTDQTRTRRPVGRLGIAAALALLCASGCGGESEAPAAQNAPAAVQVAAEDAVRAERKAIRTGARISGSLDARKRADMRAEAGGRVLEVQAELGQTVKKGQLLARIEASAQGDAVRSAQAAMRSARENLTVARRQVERTDALVKGGALAERDLESARSAAVAAEAQLGQAQAQLASARTQLGNATVRSPMEGVVSQAPVHTGDVVAPGAQLFTIIDPTSMRLEASVPSDDLRSVSVGTPVWFVVHGYPGQKFQGVIERVAPAADPATRQIPILVSIPNESGKLVAGLFADGRLGGASREALVVPAAAIDSSGEMPTATRVTRGIVERVSVQLGVKDSANELVEVVSGLSQGDVVLVRGARGLPPGTRVEVADGKQGEPEAKAEPAAAKPGEAEPGAGGTAGR
ncbi:MAG TPA: efflux RND transporter periplasmic adaptor subunit [Kofleriaceae bacterium]|nr:efflux RND transporter periplasmic adaptor subunit [Kofleriaceae bacterium]